MHRTPEWQLSWLLKARKEPKSWPARRPGKETCKQIHDWRWQACFSSHPLEMSLCWRKSLDQMDFRNGIRHPVSLMLMQWSQEGGSRGQREGIYTGAHKAHAPAPHHWHRCFHQRLLSQQGNPSLTQNNLSRGPAKQLEIPYSQEGHPFVLTGLDSWLSWSLSSIFTHSLLV